MKYPDAYKLCQRYTKRDIDGPVQVWMRYPWVADGHMHATDGVWLVRVPVECEGAGVCLSPDFGPQSPREYVPALRNVPGMFDLDGYVRDEKLRCAWNIAEDALRGLVTPAKRGDYGGRRRLVVSFSSGSEGYTLTTKGMDRTGISVDARRLLYIGSASTVYGSFEAATARGYIHLMLPVSGAHVVLCRCV